jgi:hypothetical protein
MSMKHYADSNTNKSTRCFSIVYDDSMDGKRNIFGAFHCKQCAEGYARNILGARNAVVFPSHSEAVMACCKNWLHG